MIEFEFVFFKRFKICLKTVILNRIFNWIFEFDSGAFVKGSEVCNI